MGQRDVAKVFVDAIFDRLRLAYDSAADPILKAEVFDIISRKCRRLAKEVRAKVNNRTPIEIEAGAQAILNETFAGDDPVDLVVDVAEVPPTREVIDVTPATPVDEVAATPAATLDD